MKRFYLIAMAMFSALSISAETSIQNTFFGCTLGKSTSKEVQAAMTQQGFLLLDKIDSTIVEPNKSFEIKFSQYNYEGDYMHEGHSFQSIKISFLNDTLFTIAMPDSCSKDCISKCHKIQENLNTKYGNLEKADSTLLFQQIADSATVWGLKIWSRHDEHTMVVTALSDSVYSCTYLSKNVYYNLLRSSLRHFIDTLFDKDPNYSEENKVYGVAGVKFGDDKETVRRIIAPKSDRLLDSDTNTLEYYKTRVGGTTYQYANFCFIQGKLATAFFDQPFALWEKEEALMFLSSIKSQYEKKYSNMRTITDEDNEKLYACGAYMDDYNYLPILIQFKKAMNQGNKIMYYVIVSYYQMRTNNFYDDEI